MPKSRTVKHGSGKRPPPQRPYVTDLELSQALRERLDDRELQALEKQIQRAVEKAADEVARKVATESYKRHWAITMRVLRDRFGWGKIRIRRLWDACIDYLHDIDDGILTTEDMLQTLEYEDGIRLTWSATRGEDRHD